MSTKRNMTKLEEEYFDRIRKTWLKLKDGRKKLPRIIPFCTPVQRDPIALVIGQNHSYFDPVAIAMKGIITENRLKADKEANAYTEAVPEESIYLNGLHKPFVAGLQSICCLAGIQIDETWVGTNRCAIQTGTKPEDFDELKKLKGKRAAFSDCQEEMDGILLQLIDEIKPRNVLLCGEYAAGLFFDEKKIGVLDTKLGLLEPDNDQGIMYIPVYHPSRVENFYRSVERLKHFKQ